MLSSTFLRVLTPLALTAAIALAGCGDDGGDEAASPLDEALGYLPADAGFALIASTDVADYEAVGEIVEKFPFGGQVEDALEQSLQREGVDFEKDLEPLLGNEVVLGTDDNASFTNSSEDTPFILAVETRDADKLRDLVERDGRGRGATEGYDVFQGQEDDTWVAVKDEVVVLSDDEETLKRALERRGGDDRLSEEDLDATFANLSADAPVRVYANLAALLAADPDTEEARKVKWVDHLETFGLTANATADAISLEYAVTTADGLSDGDLPLAGGSEAPRLLERDQGSGEILIGLRDLSQTIAFATAAGRVLDPAGYARFETGKKAVGRRLEIDVDKDVIAQLSGDVSATVTLDGDFGARAELEDADAFERTLAKIMDGLPEFSDDVAVTKPTGGAPFYRVTSSGGDSYAVGVAGGALVVATDPRLASDVAARGLTDAAGQEGAFVAAADAERLANEAIAKYAGGLQGLGGSLFTGPLGQLLTSAEASTEGLIGRLELEIE